MKKLKITESLCMGQCKKGANIKINNQTHNYTNPAKASEIIKKAYK
jgi:NADH:ubiquinone oxidoreductase subunit E